MHILVFIEDIKAIKDKKYATKFITARKALFRVLRFFDAEQIYYMKIYDFTLKVCNIEA